MNSHDKKSWLTLGAIVLALLLLSIFPLAMEMYQHLTQTQQLLIMIPAGGGVLIGLIFGCIALYDKSASASITVSGIVCAVVLWRMGILASLAFAIGFTVGHSIISLPASWINKRIHRNDQVASIAG